MGLCRVVVFALQIRDRGLRNEPNSAARNSVSAATQDHPTRIGPVLKENRSLKIENPSFETGSRIGLILNRPLKTFRGFESSSLSESDGGGRRLSRAKWPPSPGGAAIPFESANCDGPKDGSTRFRREPAKSINPRFALKKQ
jgi:hypothetical protein